MFAAVIILNFAELLKSGLGQSSPFCGSEKMGEMDNGREAEVKGSSLGTFKGHRAILSCD